MDMIVRTRDRFGLIPRSWSPTPPMARRQCSDGWSRAGHRSAHPGDRQVRTQGRHVLAGKTSPTIPRPTAYTCPGGKQLCSSAAPSKTPRPASMAEDRCAIAPARRTASAARSNRDAVRRSLSAKSARSIHEHARDRARDITKTDAYVTASYARKKVEMLFAHLKRILGLDRLRLRGPNGAKDEFLMAATAQNLRKLAMPLPATA